jgi:hypothetical protein
MADPFFVDYQGGALVGVFGGFPSDNQTLQTGALAQMSYSNSLSAAVTDPATASTLSAAVTGTAAVFHLAASASGQAATQAYEASADGNLNLSWGETFTLPGTPLSLVHIPWTFAMADTLSVTGVNIGNSSARAIGTLRIEYGNIVTL